MVKHALMQIYRRIFDVVGLLFCWGSWWHSG